MAHRRHDHERHKQEDKWRDAHEADPFSAEHRAHGSLQALRDQVERERSGAEFWLPIILLVLLIAGAETFLPQWFSRSK